MRPRPPISCEQGPPACGHHDSSTEEWNAGLGRVTHPDPSGFESCPVRATDCCPMNNGLGRGPHVCLLSPTARR